MRLYLNAESKNKIGYTPDWLKVTYEEDGQVLELVLDIQGSIDYDRETLSCRCKGELIPWVLWNCETGDETDLYELSNEECDAMFPEKKIAEIVCNSKDYEIGIYPVSDDVFKEALMDVLSDCEGLFEMFIDENHYYTKEFKFDTEVNF
jgi:hypothetical protein